MASAGLPSLATLADLQSYSVFRSDFSHIPDGSKIHSLGKIECQGRRDCIGCSHLVRDTEQKLQLIFDNRGDILWALCEQESRENPKILTIEFPRINLPQEASLVQYGSTRCPRTHGSHTS